VVVEGRNVKVSIRTFMYMLILVILCQGSAGGVGEE